MPVNLEVADRIVDLLNAALAADPAAVHTLVINRVPCNSQLADHPDISVESNDHHSFVNMVGILNGICGVDYKFMRNTIACRLDPSGHQGMPNLVQFYVPDEIRKNPDNIKFTIEQKQAPYCFHPTTDIGAEDARTECEGPSDAVRRCGADQESNEL